jgi:hypothetical protein
MAVDLVDVELVKDVEVVEEGSALRLSARICVE